MSCITVLNKLLQIKHLSNNFKEQLIEKLKKALHVSSIANTVINKQNDINMKHVEEVLETGTSRMNDAPTPASTPAPASTAA